MDLYSQKQKKLKLIMNSLKAANTEEKRIIDLRKETISLGKEETVRIEVEAKITEIITKAKVLLDANKLLTILSKTDLL
jgi:hypothetical protein